MKTMMLLTFLLFAGAGTALHAQEVVGVTVVDGKRVELLEDQTWRYASADDSAAGDCRSLNSVVSFCGGTDWTSTMSPSPDFLAAFRLDDRSYGGVIYEGVGAATGMSNEFMRNVLIQFAAQATGVSEEQIPILGIEDTFVDEQPAEVMSYALSFNGLDVVYQNTILVADQHTIQFLVWTLGTEFGEKQRAVAADFIERIQLDLTGQ